VGGPRLGDSRPAVSLRKTTLAARRSMKQFMNMQRTGITALVAAVLALWLGYYSGYHHGVRQERQAWLATEQTETNPPADVAADGHLHHRPATAFRRTVYSDPHSGQIGYESVGRPPVNVPDPRDTPVR
jgi:hypothetical protein